MTYLISFSGAANNHTALTVNHVIILTLILSLGYLILEVIISPLQFLASNFTTVIKPVLKDVHEYNPLRFCRINWFGFYSHSRATRCSILSTNHKMWEETSNHIIKVESITSWMNICTVMFYSSLLVLLFLMIYIWFIFVIKN